MILIFKIIIAFISFYLRPHNLCINNFLRCVTDFFVLLTLILVLIGHVYWNIEIVEREGQIFYDPEKINVFETIGYIAFISLTIFDGVQVPWVFIKWICLAYSLRNIYKENK
jgi:hypothetical protein